jgi:hypothetical protein
MPTRIFGAVAGPGVQVREVTPAKPIQAGPLGSTLLVGAFRRGPVAELVDLTGGLPDYRRQLGGLSQDSEAPLAAEHFYSVGVGAGHLYAYRVTDGSEVKASINLYNRDVDRGILERAEAVKAPTVVLELTAHNGGRWGGRRKRQAGDIGTIASAVSGATVNLGITPLKDAWKGAILTFPNDDSATEYLITGNTTAGVFTVSGSFTAATLAGTDGRFRLELENAHELTGNLEALAVEVQDGGEGSTTFSLSAYTDGLASKAWENVDLDATGDRYWFDTITTDRVDNWELGSAADNFTGDPADPYQLPANFAEIPAPAGVDANALTFQVIRWTSSGTGNPYLDTVNDVTWGADPIPCTITITFTGATTYTVGVELEDGGTVTGLPGGTTGVAYASQHAWLPGWTISAGAVAADATTRLVIYARPLPADLKGKGGYLYIAAGPSEGLDQSTRYRVVSNDHETVTLANGVDLEADGVLAPSAPTMTGTTAGPFALNAATLTLIYSVGGSGPYTLTESLGGAAETTTALAADLNAQELARAGSAAAKLVAFTVSAADKLIVTALQDFGGSATITLGSGTLNAVVGFTNGQAASGTNATIARLQWRQELGGGYDGLASVTADDYAAAWDLGASPLNDLDIVNTGVIRAAMPGITDADAQAAAIQWAYEHNAVFYAEIPDTVTTEAGAVAWHKANLAIGAPQDYAPAVWPSYCLVKSPYGSGLYTCPVIGLVLGRTAKIAVEASGYHQAGAGTTALLSPIAKDLPTQDRRLNSELLGGYGLIEIRKRGPRIFIFGDRIAGDGGRPFLHERLTRSHIGRTLLVNTEALVFRQINAVTFTEVKRQIRALFTSWWLSGWFDDVDGPAFEDQVSIKVDASNNPTTERDLGNLHADIGFQVVATAERVIFQIGPRGVSAS